ASAGVRSPSTATQAIVVLARGWALNLAPPQSSRSNGATSAPGRTPPNSPAISNGWAQKARLLGMVAEPQQLTQASAPIVKPSWVTMLALPWPPFSAPALAPSPAPALPSGTMPARV